MLKVLLLVTIAITIVVASTVTTASAFSKSHPVKPPVGFKEGGEKDLSHPMYTTNSEAKRARIEAAMPVWDDKVDRDMLECSGCLCVSDVIASRFSKLKGEFKFTMEKLREYHIEAAIDNLCTDDARHIGLIMPNHTHPAGQRAIDRYLKEVIPEENQRKAERTALREKLVAEGKSKPGNKEWEELNKADSQAVARRAKQVRDAVIVFSEYGDEREIYASIKSMRRDQRAKETKEQRIARKRRQRELAEKGEVDPELEDEPDASADIKIDDVSVIKTLEWATRWQNICSEALERMDDFGTMRVFKGSTSFKLCPMCRSKSTDSETTKAKKSTLLHNRNDNPGTPTTTPATTNKGDASEKPSFSSPATDANIKAAETNEKRKVVSEEVLGTPGNTRRDAGDDEEDERYLHELEEDL